MKYIKILIVIVAFLMLVVFFWETYNSRSSSALLLNTPKDEVVDLSLVSRVEALLAIDDIKNPNLGSNYSIVKEYVSGGLKFWEISGGDSINSTYRTISFNPKTQDIFEEERYKNLNTGEIQKKNYSYNLKSAEELRAIIAQESKTSSDQVSIRFFESSADGVAVKGSVGVGCVRGGTEEENQGCTGLLYASKALGVWKYVSGTGFSCREILDIGIPAEMALSNFSRAACER